MKLVILLSALVGCSNAYAMQNDQLSQNLSEANRLMGESETMINKMNHFLMVALFTSSEASHAYVTGKKAEASLLAHQAKNLAEEINKNEKVDLTTKEQADKIVLRAHKVIEK